MTDAETGGKIEKKKVRFKQKKKDDKLDEALEKQAQGGAINKKKIRVKQKKKDEKLEEALEKQAQGGYLKKKKTFHDPIHKHLHANLSGRGGRVDPPYVRKKMAELMSSYHPALFQTYMRGKAHDLPQDHSFSPGAPVKQNRPDVRAHVVDSGGSLSALHHSVNGVLTSVDSTFYHHLEVV